eukprot:8204-Amphidinium_carterae.1
MPQATVLRNLENTTKARKNLKWGEQQSMGKWAAFSKRVVFGKKSRESFALFWTFFKSYRDGELLESCGVHQGAAGAPGSIERRLLQRPAGASGHVMESKANTHEYKHMETMLATKGFCRLSEKCKRRQTPTKSQTPKGRISMFST